MKQIATELIKCIDFEQKRSAYYTKVIIIILYFYEIQANNTINRSVR
jgi:hypothetical protein